MPHNTQEILSTARTALITEANAILDAANSLPTSFADAVRLISTTPGHLIISGIGKSGHISTKMAATFASTGTPSFFIHPTEAYHGDLGSFTADDSALLISNSGETEEVIRLIPILQERGIQIISMTGNPNSTLAKNSNVHLPISIDREACPNNLAPTTSTTLTLALGDALAISLIQLKKFSPEDFANHHPGGSLGKSLSPVIRNLSTSSTPTVTPSSSPQTIIHSITTGKLGLTLVIHNNSLLGIITDGDLRRAMNDLSSFSSKSAQDIMSPNPTTIPHTLRVLDAQRLLNQLRIKAAPVIDDNNNILGIFSL